MTFDAPTLTALAASAAALVAATVAGIQFYVGRKQADAALTSARAALMNAQNAGRHTIAEFRQKWIDNVIETLCAQHAIIMNVPAGAPLPMSEARALYTARTKLTILLNPEEADTVALLEKMDAIFASPTTDARSEQSAAMLVVARRLLKREWVRIKGELSDPPPTPNQTGTSAQKDDLCPLDLV
jgi:23S rRNA G2445 N2-methylase RlmL